MTDTNSLQSLHAQLEEANRDAALWLRLKGAEERAKCLNAEYQQAKVDYDVAEAANAKAAHEAQFAGLRNLSITEALGDKSTSVLSSRFTIIYTRDAWDTDAHATLPQIVSKPGFGALDANVFAWIVERHPEKIPASIMALAPNDAEEALNCYLAALRRGFLKG